MATFLRLVKDLCNEVGVADGEDAISTVVSQTGELRRLVNWTRDSYTEIQNRHGGRWRWLRRSFTVNTAADDDSYAYGDVTDVDAAAVITRFNQWLINDRDNPPKIYLTASGVGAQRWLVYIPWEDFQILYRIGTQNSQAPVHITVDPQDNIVLGPKPDDTYTVTGEFFRSPQTLDIADGTDSPEMPAQYQSVITYRAMQKYGRFESAEEMLSSGEVQERRMMRQLETNQLPMPFFAGPMVA